jgi:hypothetical protein
VGFEVLEARDVALVEGLHVDEGEPWYMPLVPSFHPFKWPRFQFNFVMIRLMPIILRYMVMGGGGGGESEKR